MLIPPDRQHEIAKRLQHIAQLRHRAKKTNKNSTHKTSVIIQEMRTLPKPSEIVKLPHIHISPDKEQPKKEETIKKQGKKQSVETDKLMSLIKKELVLEKRSYFQTISSDNALIIRNSLGKHSNSQRKNNRTSRTKNEEERDQLITPPLRTYPIEKSEADELIKKSNKKIIQPMDPQESCSPWNMEEPSQNHLSPYSHSFQSK